MVSVGSRVLSTSSSESLSLALKLSACSLLGDCGGKRTSSFELDGSSRSLGTLSAPFSEFKLTARPVHCVILSYISLSDGFTMHFSPRPHFSLFVSGYLL